jgi:DNA-binding transcriptional ArsR family regulator
MKESLQDSPDGRAAPGSGRRIIRDVDAMRALVHPDRLAILLFLLAAPTRTATQCAAEIGVTPSACSYHLRELERFGYVERVAPHADGRTRPWRAAAVGFSLGDDWSDDSPDGRAARHAIGRAELAENRRLVERFFDGVDDLDPTWQAATDFHNFELMVTPAELNELNGAVATLLRQFRAPARTDPPADAAAVHVVYQAFPRRDP